jgi:hypothetical protein
MIYPAEDRLDVAADSPKWTPTVGSDEKLEDVSLESWIGQAIGAASTCWESMWSARAGEFQSDRAKAIAEALLEHVQSVIDKAVAAREPIFDLRTADGRTGQLAARDEAYRRGLIRGRAEEMSDASNRVIEVLSQMGWAQGSPAMVTVVKAVRGENSGS